MIAIRQEALGWPHPITLHQLAGPLHEMRPTIDTQNYLWTVMSPWYLSTVPLLVRHGLDLRIWDAVGGWVMYNVANRQTWVSGRPSTQYPRYAKTEGKGGLMKQHTNNYIDHRARGANSVTNKRYFVNFELNCIKSQHLNLLLEFYTQIYRLSDYARLIFYLFHNILKCSHYSNKLEVKMK